MIRRTEAVMLHDSNPGRAAAADPTPAEHEE